MKNYVKIFSFVTLLCVGFSFGFKQVRAIGTCYQGSGFTTATGYNSQFNDNSTTHHDKPVFVNSAGDLLFSFGDLASWGISGEYNDSGSTPDDGTYDYWFSGTDPVGTTMHENAPAPAESGASFAECGTTTPPFEEATGTPTSTIEQVQTNLFYGIFLFVIMFIGIIWVMRSH